MTNAKQCFAVELDETSEFPVGEPRFRRGREHHARSIGELIDPSLSARAFKTREPRRVFIFSDWNSRPAEQNDEHSCNGNDRRDDLRGITRPGTLRRFSNLRSRL